MDHSLRLSPAMKSMLRYHLVFHNSDKVQLGRPMYHGNLVTHNALLRRELIKEADGDRHICTLTPAGLKVAQELG